MNIRIHSGHKHESFIGSFLLFLFAFMEGERATPNRRSKGEPVARTHTEGGPVYSEKVPEMWLDVG